MVVVLLTMPQTTAEYIWLFMQIFIICAACLVIGACLLFWQTRKMLANQQKRSEIDND